METSGSELDQRFYAVYGNQVRGADAQRKLGRSPDSGQDDQQQECASQLSGKR